MRALVLVIDALGIGALPDADDYGDAGAHTLRSICRAAQKNTQVQWPNLLALGLGNAAALTVEELSNCPPVPGPTASFGAMIEQSRGKDTTTGHWELAGLISARGFHIFSPAYPSFPPELVARLEQATGYKLIGNRAVSGTVIIEELGSEQMSGGKIIGYTSADSVMQLAAHEAVISPEALYRICEQARTICNDYQVARVIARPFTGRPGAFTRTSNRRDFSIELPGPSVLDRLLEHGVETVGIGKIGDIFNHQGLSRSYPDKGNAACLKRVAELLREQQASGQLIFVNLVDTDMLYGHRRDPVGYYRAVQEIDRALTGIIDLLTEHDMLIITADHGCDPGFSGTDHTREYVPLLILRPGRAGRCLGIRASFAEVAATLCAFFKSSRPGVTPRSDIEKFLGTCHKK
jgi:phosphopentomutase